MVITFRNRRNVESEDWENRQIFALTIILECKKRIYYYYTPFCT